MWLKSSGFDSGAVIPQRYTCDGENLSPPLHWGDVPDDTRSLAIVCVDPDAPSGAFYHWIAYNIVASTTGLAEGTNDFGKSGYGGPCPPRGHGPHHYEFRLLALSKDRLDVAARTTCRLIERAARGSLLEEASLVALYSR
jgi:Raf kinase inhibitor-like YbhB/YbcL family protein